MEFSHRRTTFFQCPLCLAMVLAMAWLGCSDADRETVEQDQLVHAQVTPRYQAPEPAPAAEQTSDGETAFRHEASPDDPSTAAPQHPEATGASRADADWQNASPPAQLRQRVRSQKRRLKKVPIPDPEPEVELPDVDDIVFSIPDAPPKLMAELPAEPNFPRSNNMMLGFPDAPPPVIPETPVFEETIIASPALPPPADDQQIRFQGMKALTETPKPKAKSDLAGAARAETKDLDRRAARRWLAARASLDDVAPLPKTGYWTNTYLPGDPGARFLESSLSGAGADLPHRSAKRTTPLFDPPNHAALGVSLQADRAASEGRARLLLQVGLMATERFKGRRTAMNLGILVHLPGGLSAANAKLLRAALLGLAEERDFEDQFHLLVVTNVGSFALPSDEFRHGPLTVLCDVLEAGKPFAHYRYSVDAALDRVLSSVIDHDDPSAPLGSSGLMVITDRSFEPQEQLEGRFHEAAVAGLPVTTVGLNGADRAQLERLALIGHGRRYFLESLDQARQVAGRELAAASQTVARAIRLNIRLAPEVELLGVLGSSPMDEQAKARVKTAEKSIDLRLAQKLGIASDRGDDEDGIQIVIPAFYAGDFHTILLDVVAEPGPVAEVTARFKDLMYLDNGTARAQLELGKGESRMGPFQEAVLLDHISHTVQGALESSADHLSKNRLGATLKTLHGLRQLLLGLESEVPSLAGHPQLIADRSMIGRFLDLAGRQAPSLDASLRLAGLLKTRPAPIASESRVSRPESR